MVYILYGYLIAIEAGIIILHSITVYMYKCLDAVRSMLPDEHSQPLRQLFIYLRAYSLVLRTRSGV